MVMRGQRPMVAWQERTEVDFWDIYLKAGTTGRWLQIDGSATGRGMSAGGSGGSPAIAHRDANVWVAWQQVDGSVTNIVVKKLEGGSEWVGVDGSDAEAGINDTAANSLFPSIAIFSDGVPAVAWLSQTEVGGVFEPRIRVHSAANAQWQGLDGIDATFGNGGAALPPIRLASDGSDVLYAAWVERNANGNNALHVKRWDNTDGWRGLDDEPRGMVPTTGEVGQPALAVETGGVVHLAWRRTFPQSSQIFYKRFAGSWDSVGGSTTGFGISNSEGYAIEPSITLQGPGLPAIAWADSSPGGWDIYLKEWRAGAWQEIGGSATGRGISGTEPHSRQPVVAYDSNLLCVSWVDGGASAPEIALRCHDRP